MQKNNNQFGIEIGQPDQMINQDNSKKEYLEDYTISKNYLIQKLGHEWCKHPQEV